MRIAAFVLSLLLCGLGCQQATEPTASPASATEPAHGVMRVTPIKPSRRTLVRD